MWRQYVVTYLQNNQALVAGSFSDRVSSGFAGVRGCQLLQEGPYLTIGVVLELGTDWRVENDVFSSHFARFHFDCDDFGFVVGEGEWKTVES